MIYSDAKRATTMARRRVFQTEIKCPGISDIGLTSNRNALIGRAVTLEKSASTSDVSVLLERAVVGHLDSVVGPQVARLSIVVSRLGW